MLLVPSPGTTQTLLDQFLRYALPILGIDVIQQPPITVTSPGPELYTHRITCQLPEPVSGVLEARLTSFRGIYSKKPNLLSTTTRAEPALKCVTVNDPAHRYDRTVETAPPGTAGPG